MHYLRIHIHVLGKSHGMTETLNGQVEGKGHQGKGQGKGQERVRTEGKGSGR